MPEAIRTARSILSEDSSEFEWVDLEDGYKIASYPHREGGYKHRWMIVSSRGAHFKEIATLEKNLQKEEDYLNRKIRRINRRDFYSNEEALREVGSLRKNHPLFKFEQSIRRLSKKVNCRGHRKWKYLYSLKVLFRRNKDRIRHLTNRGGSKTLSRLIEGRGMLQVH